VLFAAAAPHQPSRSATRALKSMTCGTRRCGSRGSGRAAWVRYVWAAAGFRRPVGGESPAADRRWAAAPTQTKRTNRHANRQCPSGSARRRTQARAHTRTDTQYTHTQTHARMRTHARKHTHTNTHTDSRTHARAHTHICTRTHLMHTDTYAHTHTTRTRSCRRSRPKPCRAARAGCCRDARTHECTHARAHARMHVSAICTACGCNGRARLPPTRASRMASTPLTGDVLMRHSLSRASCACLGGAMHCMRIKRAHRCLQREQAERHPRRLRVTYALRH
jgi:hypothetical protein